MQLGQSAEKKGDFAPPVGGKAPGVGIAPMVGFPVEPQAFSFTGLEGAKIIIDGWGVISHDRLPWLSPRMVSWADGRLQA